RDVTRLGERYKGYEIVLHSTGFDSCKGTDLVIKSLPLICKQVPNTKLLITYTRVNRGKLKKYLRFIKSFGLQDNVEFLGFVKYESLPGYYSLAKIYVEPGIGRAMSLSNKEAMACGTPVIRGNDSDEEVIDGVTGFLVNPFSKVEFAEKVVFLLRNQELNKKMGSAARDFVLKNFSWEKVAERIGSQIQLIKRKKYDTSD
ncbi:MAG TPA: glycosyltransferase, partial [bacterium]|nr:glycosyltransferase [bacterium]